MSLPVIHIWKKAPFIRFLLPLIAGIVLQWHLQIQPGALWIVLCISSITAVSFFFIPFFERYKFSALSGLSVTVLFIALGGLLSWYKNIQYAQDWFGKNYNNENILVVTLLENPVEKTKSYKANASVDYILQNDACIKTKGTIILYFKKESGLPILEYGSQLVITKPLQEIKNSGNPGGFDYKRYSLFQGITHQVYLQASVPSGKENEFAILPTTNKTFFQQFINTSRAKVLDVLRKNIKGEKELGLAEALLIGYKDDLDKTLVQSYSNTGVVHVIAISGLHLGLIYWLLTWFFKPFQKRKTFKWIRPVLILAGLWLFSLLAGAQPSVLRSAFMFTCIVLGDSFERKSSIYNTLALSALLLLCINPFWLWDVGFQLSYAAVLSIVIFMQPIYHWFYIKNKLLDLIWKLNAVTIAAQILTVPIGIYHFHQFPLNFLLTNFLAVPLSSFILLDEILLCIISFIPPLAAFIGQFISWLIWIMNSYIERIEMLPFSLWDGLQISILQTILLLGVAVGLGSWLMEKNKPALKYALAALFGFAVLRTVSFMQANNRQQLIVYNVPQKRAIDLINGRKYLFLGDSDLLADDFIRNFHMKPSRILHRIEPAVNFENFWQQENLLICNNKKILAINETKYFFPLENKVPVDLLLVSGNPKLYFTQLTKTFSVKQVVFDSSCPFWKTNLWKKDCDSLHIPYHDVSEKGAFVMSLR
ncbi:MAG TPA: ComEC/Rec2 family competence protein [Chitinophagaceae bacterium]|nr:ComEC/Rec2 family competence protein [Chitinophagaceae bacterium]